MAQELWGIKIHGRDYRFLVDARRKKLRLYEKNDKGRLIPLAVWPFETLIIEMAFHED